jgi:hypothetical protein
MIARFASSASSPLAELCHSPQEPTNPASITWIVSAFARRTGPSCAMCPSTRGSGASAREAEWL